MKKFKWTGTLFVIATLIYSIPAHATRITVTTTQEGVLIGDRQCTLAEAILEANTTGASQGDCMSGEGADFIDIPAGNYILTRPYAGLNGLPPLQSPITIQGSSAGESIITRASGAAKPFRILEISPTAPQTAIAINSVTIEGGFLEITDNMSQDPIHGAGIYQTGGKLTVNQSRLTRNISKNVNDFAYGGGIYSNASLTVTHTIISDNVAYLGAGIYSGSKEGSARLDVRDAIISGNRVWSEFGEGGGIYSMGLLAISDSTLTENEASYGGAVTSVAYTGDTRRNPKTIYHSTIRNSTFSGNKATQGGAVSYGHQYAPLLPTAVIAQSNFYQNTAMDGGAVYDVSKQLDIQNTTFAYNSASIMCRIIISTDNPDTPEEEPTEEEDRLCGSGGAMMVSGYHTTITNTTIAYNEAEDYGGGLELNNYQMRAHAEVALGNVILTENIALQEGGDCYQAGQGATFSIASLGNNLVTEASSCIGFISSDLLGIDAELGSYIKSDTAGQSHFPLLDTSPAIDAGNNDNCPTRDQLGNARDQSCDIGAIEYINL